MKKVISVLLILILTLTACGPKEESMTEEEIRAEILEELAEEAEEAAEEAEEEAEEAAKEAEEAAEEAEEAAEEAAKAAEELAKLEEETDDNDLEDSEQVLTFDEVYVDDLEVAIDYFNENFDAFSEKGLGDFSAGIIGQLETMYISMNDVSSGGGLLDIPMTFEPMYPSFDDDLYECYAFSSNEFNINSFRDDYTRDSCITLRDDPYFTLAVNIWATDGYLDMPYFSVILDEEMYQKMNDIIAVYINVAGSSALQDWVPNIEFDNVDNVINNTSVTYPKVLLHEFSEAEAFMDQDTWKTTLYLPVEFVEGEAPSEDSGDTDTSEVLEGALTRFTNETLYSIDEEVYVDYAKYHLVLIPEQDTVNANILSERTIDITNTGSEYPLKFTVLGELSLLEFTYYENLLDDTIEPLIVTVEGPFMDEIITVNAYLPYDFSGVMVSAMYQYMSGIDRVEFGLDDMRDPETHEIFMLEAKSYTSEY